MVRTRDRDQVRAATDAMLHVIDDSVATLTDAYADAGRQMVRREEALRRDLIDDLPPPGRPLSGNPRRTHRQRATLVGSHKPS